VLPAGLRHLVWLRDNNIRTFCRSAEKLAKPLAAYSSCRGRHRCQCHSLSDCSSLRDSVR
jgi:hypothetical protein